MEKKIEICVKDKINHYVKGTYSGSYKGMRYFIFSKMNEAEERILMLCIWPEPYCYSATETEKKRYFEFLFSEEGLKELEDKVNDIWEKEKETWLELAGISTLHL